MDSNVVPRLSYSESGRVLSGIFVWPTKINFRTPNPKPGKNKIIMPGQCFPFSDL
jgi:hypothetical protein